MKSLAASDDGRTATRLGFALFVLAAWPLALVRVPPLQDLPNHLAAAHIIAHPDLHPEYAFNGFLKTNSALFAWLHFVGRFVGLELAARLFTLLVLAVTAFALPRLFVRVCGQGRAIVACLFAWPMVHGWFVSMGMLNYALGFALSVALLTMLDRQREAPSLRRALAITALALATWYAHAFPLLVVSSLAALHSVLCASWRERFARARALLLPLAPAATLVAASAVAHFAKPASGPARANVLVVHRLHELLENLWYDELAGFTWLSAASLVPAVLLPLFVWKRWRESASFFSPLASAALVVAYVELPFAASNWWYFNSRLIPFVWLALLVRVPPSLPRAATRVLVASAVLYSAAMGVDYVRLDRDRAAFTAGIDAVPDRATLLPLVFESRKTSDFTSSLEHAWGFYVLAKSTSAPLVFAVEKSYPITYRTFPPAQLVPPALDGFARANKSAASVCDELLRAGVAAVDCDAEWRARWSAFWKLAEPRFDHVLTWAAPPSIRSLVPASYHVAFESGDLAIYARELEPSPP